MKKQELENRLRNFETLVFSNETDVFEFMFSRLLTPTAIKNQELFKVRRNGSFKLRSFTVSGIMQLIKLHKLKLEEL